VEPREDIREDVLEWSQRVCDTEDHARLFPLAPRNRERSRT
jgi:hypothetical protein